MPLLQPTYIRIETSATYNDVISDERGFMLDEFEKEVSRFYARLLERQQPLGEEFEKVLHENLWDLYES